MGESGCIVQGEVVSTKLVEGGSGSGVLAGKEGAYKARKEHLKSHLKSKFVFIFIIFVTTIKCAVVILDQKSLIKKWKARNYDKWVNI